MFSILRSVSRLTPPTRSHVTRTLTTNILRSHPFLTTAPSLTPSVISSLASPLLHLQIRNLTLNQATRRKPKHKSNQSVSVALENNYQKKGVCTQIFTMNPKKPNSANRKVARVKLSNGKTIIAYIQGEGHNLQEHSVVLVRGGRAQDLPGVRYAVRFSDLISGSSF